MRAEEGDGSDRRARAAVRGKARRCARACGWERAKRARGPRVAFWAEVWAVQGKARESGRGEERERLGPGRGLGCWTGPDWLG